MRMLLIILAFFAGILALLSAYTAWESHRIALRYPPRGQLVEVAGGQLHYTEKAAIGPERGTVLLLHGASGNEADVMLPLGNLLSTRGYRVLAFDRPGYGWSDRLGADTPAKQANLIHEALRRLGIDRTIVLGHSLAGVLATNLALDHRDLVQGLVLVAPVTHPWPGGTITWYYTIASLPGFGWIFSHVIALPVGQLVFDAALNGVFAPQPVPPDYRHRTGVEQVLRPASFLANAQDVAGIYDVVRGQAPRLPQISAPTAIVTGDSDTIVLTQVHSYGSERDIPGARLTVLPGVGHSPHWANPEAVAAAIEDVAQRSKIPAHP